MRATPAYGPSESKGPAELDVTVQNDDAAAITVDYATADGQARAGSDYVPTSGQLSFPPGDSTQAIQVPIIDDSVDEPGEDFHVNLSGPSVSPQQADLEIYDDDLVYATIDPATALESSGQVEFHVHLSGPSYQDQEMIMRALSASPDWDFDAPPITVRIPAGALEGSFAVPIPNDSLLGPERQLHVFRQLQPSGDAQTRYGRPLDAEATIFDDDVPAIVAPRSAAGAAHVAGLRRVNNSTMAVGLACPTRGQACAGGVAIAFRTVTRHGKAVRRFRMRSGHRTTLRMHVPRTALISRVRVR